MAGSINKVILVGNLGRDPEANRLASGDPVVRMSIATSETWRDKQSGERKERTEWHRVVIFNETLCKVATEYLRKGSKVYLEGQLATRKWQDQQGVEKYATEVVLQKYRGELTILDGGQGRPPPEPDSYGSMRTREDGGAGYAAAKAGDSFGRRPGASSSHLDDDIPF
ncbi:single-stranded DNA-binding protein [Bosea sp. (in: a-proteobacteria)]|uniref:single-stranded DNA-binding protein n=1 Tax=Bosea sp. (in: a-proteobacteria) TaxID=1871050 RepID=UPI0025BF6207|nr:single-stranded DNA-binding protein [Bosea sp. (in: a-proteobacteria)]MBR3191526.1 single-stranded DNA-binding protein [Bosea sp. (in: a-proteobacteria)]